MKPSFEEWRKSLPPVVALVLVLIWSIHLTRLVTGSPAGSDFALTSYWPRGLSEAYRVLTGPLLHGDGLHITLNSLAWASTGPKLEARFGTILFAWLTFLVTVLSGLIYVGTLSVFRTLSPTPKDAEWTFQATV